MASARSETESGRISCVSEAASEEALNEVQDGIAQEEEVAADLREEAHQGAGYSHVGPVLRGTGVNTEFQQQSGRSTGTLTRRSAQPMGQKRMSLDIAAPPATNRRRGIGTVVLMQSEAESGGYGLFTCVDHGGGLSTCYAHQSEFGTSVRASVKQGEVIGYVGKHWATALVTTFTSKYGSMGRQPTRWFANWGRQTIRPGDLQRLPIARVLQVEALSARSRTAFEQQVQLRPDSMAIKVGANQHVS